MKKGASYCAHALVSVCVCVSSRRCRNEIDMATSSFLMLRHVTLTFHPGWLPGSAAGASTSSILPGS
jgi:hypothetical protein